MAICMLHGSVDKKLLRPLAMDILTLINTFAPDISINACMGGFLEEE